MHGQLQLCFQTGAHGKHNLGYKVLDFPEANCYPQEANSKIRKVLKEVSEGENWCVTTLSSEIILEVVIALGIQWCKDHRESSKNLDQDKDGRVPLPLENFTFYYKGEEQEISEEDMCSGFYVKELDDLIREINQLRSYIVWG